MRDDLIFAIVITLIFLPGAIFLISNQPEKDAEDCPDGSTQVTQWQEGHNPHNCEENDVQTDWIVTLYYSAVDISNNDRLSKSSGVFCGGSCGDPAFSLPNLAMVRIRNRR